MEIKIQFLEINPSINEMKTSTTDNFSVLLLYDILKIIIPNLEKNMNKKEISTFNVLNLKKSVSIKLYFFKNSSLIGISEFTPFNEIKWINVSNSTNNQNENNNLLKLKVNIKCSTLRNGKNINHKKNQSLLTPKIKKEKLFSSNTFQKKLSTNNNNNNSNNLIFSSHKINKNYFRNNFSIQEEFNLTDLTPQSTNNTNLMKEKNIFKSQSPISSLHYNKIVPKTNRKKYSNLRMKSPPLSRKEDINSSLKYNKNKSQKIIKIEETEKYKNYFDNKPFYTNKIDCHKLENEIIDNDFRKTLKDDDIIMEDNNIHNIKINNLNIDINKSLNSFSFIPSEDENFSLDSDSQFNKEKIHLSVNTFNTVKNDFLIFYNKDYLNSITKESLFLETQLMIDKIFELQNIFHQQFNLLNKKNIKYKYSHDCYSEKYFNMLKKYNRLREKNKRIDINKFKYDIKNPNLKKEKMIEMFKNEFKIWNKMTNTQNKKPNLNKSRKKLIFKLLIPILINYKNKLSILQKKFLNDLMEKTPLNNSLNELNKGDNKYLKNTFSGDLFNSSIIKSVVLENPLSPHLSNKNNFKREDKMLKTYKPKKKISNIIKK